MTMVKCYRLAEGKLACGNCGYVWAPRGGHPPIHCAQCGSILSQEPCEVDNDFIRGLALAVNRIERNHVKLAKALEEHSRRIKEVAAR
jgi:hypothetical protein